MRSHTIGRSRCTSVKGWLHGELAYTNVEAITKEDLYNQYAQNPGETMPWSPWSPWTMPWSPFDN